MVFNMIKRCRLFYLIISLIVIMSIGSEVLSDEPAETEKGPELGQAVMCEGIKNHRPHNPSVLFSVNRKKVFCFTEFKAVSKSTYIFHNWYRRDTFVAKVKLDLKTPRWSTYSNLSIRDTDNGPWRVEITDMDGNIFYVLRFSITE